MTRTAVRVDGSSVTLAGRIDDTTSFDALLAMLPLGVITIDTSEVAFVNSIGMRAWIRLLRALRERGAVRLVRVADPLMTQMNLIRELATTVEIVSFHAHYVCAACGAEATPLVDVSSHAALLETMKAPRLPCPECGGAMDLGDFPERYLSIFRNR